MRDLVIEEIMKWASVQGITRLEFYQIDKLTKEELDLCPDEELIDMLVHVCTYEEE